MEVPSIHRHAQRRFERASAMKQSMVELRDQLRSAKAQQKLRRVRSLSVIVESALHPGRIDAHHVAQTVQETRDVTQTAKDREQRLNALDHKIRTAVNDARVLIGLAHRASGGHVYAKHQADIMVNH